MLGFVFQKIWSKKWMIISLLLGNLLLVAITATAPMYSEAALQRTLIKNLTREYENDNISPGTINLPDTTDGKKDQYDRWKQAEDLFEQMLEELNLPISQRVNQYYKTNVKTVSNIEKVGKMDSVDYRISSYTEVEDHIQILKGQMFSNKINDNIIEVIVNEKTFIEQQLMLGQVLELPNEKNASGEAYQVQIVGIFTNRSEQDEYWRSSPNTWEKVLLMKEDLFRELFLNSEHISKNVNVGYMAVLDYAAMKGKEVTRYINVLDQYGTQYEELGFSKVYVQAQNVFEEFIPKAQKAETTVWVLLLPIFVLLAVFIFMVSRQMLEMEQNEISVYKSRGANKGQIIAVYLMQSFMIALVSLVGGIPLAVFMCKVLGASDSFLGFVKRAALPVEMSGKILLFAAGAALFSMGTMVLPVFKYADVNIVDHKRSKNRANKSPLWQKLFLDFILLGLSGYGLYQYYSQKEYLAQKVLDGASLDPVLYFCSSLFMIGAGLFVLRIFPLAVRIIFHLGKKWWSPALYTSFLRIIRTRSNQGFLMIFLILTVAAGIYNAQSARTINANAQEKMEYMTGADIVLQEAWKSNQQDAGMEGSMGGVSVTSEVTYEEPDFGKYLNLDGAESITKVLVDKKISVSVEGGKIKNAMLMGIHTKEFGETAWFKESLLPLHYHEYLNAISQNSQAILVSSNFRDIYGYKNGDVINYVTGQGKSMRGIIYGFVDYWPGYAPVTVAKGSDGIYSETENFLIVAHLAKLQSACGIMPYQVWIKAKGSSQFIYDFAQENNLRYSVFEDAAAKVIEMKNDPIFQGTNGILTIGFVCILMLCTIGFLIYWILSIQSRTLQFGIFRAMGMTMREVFTMLVNEQIFITGASIGAGVLVGILTSKLFIPLVQIAYSSADQVLPLEIVSVSSDYVRLFVVIGAVILLCMVILGGLISKIKISQALKLGED